MWTRRIGEACETAHWFDQSVGVTDRFSAERQKLVSAEMPDGAFGSGRPMTRTAPWMSTSSGVRPSPATVV